MFQFESMWFCQKLIEVFHEKYNLSNVYLLKVAWLSIPLRGFLMQLFIILVLYFNQRIFIAQSEDDYFEIIWKVGCVILKLQYYKYLL